MKIILTYLIIGLAVISTQTATASSSNSVKLLISRKVANPALDTALIVKFTTKAGEVLEIPVISERLAHPVELQSRQVDSLLNDLITPLSSKTPLRQQVWEIQAEQLEIALIDKVLHSDLEFHGKDIGDFKKRRTYLEETVIMRQDILSSLWQNTALRQELDNDIEELTITREGIESILADHRLELDGSGNDLDSLLVALSELGIREVAPYSDGQRILEAMAKSSSPPALRKDIALRYSLMHRLRGQLERSKLEHIGDTNHGHAFFIRNELETQNLQEKYWAAVYHVHSSPLLSRKSQILPPLMHASVTLPPAGFIFSD